MGQSTAACGIQLLLLADCNLKEIAELLNIDAATIRMAEELYFDVRPMLGSSHWIVVMVIRREADSGGDDLAAEMRLAYFGGRQVTLDLLNARAHLPADQAEQLYLAALQLQTKFQTAIDMPLAPDQADKFFKIFAEIQAQEQQIQLDREKLAFRMQRVGAAPGVGPDPPRRGYKMPQPGGPDRRKS